MDKTQLTALLQFIKNAPDNDSLTATILRLAADSISLDTLKSLAGSKTASISTPQKEPDSDKASGYLHFSKKEFPKMLYSPKCTNSPNDKFLNRFMYS